MKERSGVWQVPTLTKGSQKCGRQDYTNQRKNRAHGLYVPKQHALLVLTH